MRNFNNFKEKTIKEIRVWAWIAAVLPITSLAGIFFIWVFGTSDIFGIFLIIGATTMFAVAVIWWWWVTYIIRNLIVNWDSTRLNVKTVLADIRLLRVSLKSSLEDRKVNKE